MLPTGAAFVPLIATRAVVAFVDDEQPAIAPSTRR